MTTPQKRIWAFHDGPMVGLFVSKSPGVGSNVAKYVRADVAGARIGELEKALNSISANAAFTPMHPACEKILKIAAEALVEKST